jgi:hypothetical protein
VIEIEHRVYYITIYDKYPVFENMKINNIKQAFLPRRYRARTRSLFIVFCSLSIVFSVACNKSAPTVTPADVVSSYLTNEPGSELMMSLPAYPTNGATGIPVDTQIVIVFSKNYNAGTVIPGNVLINSSPAGFSIAYTAARIITITPSSDLNYNTTYTISLTTGIQDSGGQPLSQAYNWTFTTAVTDTSADMYPRVITRYPMGGTINRNTTYIEVTFSRPVTNVIAATLTIAPAVASGAPYQVGTSNTWRRNLTTPLAYSTGYAVHVDSAITSTLPDVHNLVVLPTSPDWTFTTEASPAANPAPTVTSYGVISETLTDTTATIYWTASRSIQATLSESRYGTDTAFGGWTTYGVATEYNTVHTRTIPGLTPGTRYYYQVTVDGGVTPYSGSFLTKIIPATTNPGTAMSTATDNTMVSSVQNTSSTAFRTGTVQYDGSSFVVLKSSAASSSYIWFASNATVPVPWLANVDSNNRLNIKVFSDQRGYAVITGEFGGNIYAKRVYNNSGACGFAGNGWGTNAAAAGITVGTGTNPSAAIIRGSQGNTNVYAGFITSRYSSTGSFTRYAVAGAPLVSEMSLPPNRFYDFTNNLSTLTTTGDHIIDASNIHTTIDKTSQNFIHALGQAVATVTAGENYYIASTVSLGNYTATDHNVYDTTPASVSYLNGGTISYSEHGYAPAGAFGANDLLNIGASWGRATGLSEQEALSLSIASVKTGTATATPALILEDTTPLSDFTLPTLILQNALVRNTTASLATRATANALSATQLPIANSIFSISDTYELFHGRYCLDHDTTTNSFWRIDFTPAGLVTLTDTVNIYNTYQTGIAVNPPANPLYDNDVDFSIAANTAVNDIMINVNANIISPLRARISALTFGIHAANLSAAGQIANLNDYYLLRYVAFTEMTNTIRAGSCTASAGYTFDATGCNFTAVTAIIPGDIVYNIEADTYAAVQSVAANILTLNKTGFISAGQHFLVFATQDAGGTQGVIETGTTTLLSVGNLVDSNAQFTSAERPVHPGDSVRNITAPADGYIRSVTSATSLVLGTNIFALNENYVVLQPRVLFAYQNGNNIRASIFNLWDGNAYSAPFNIVSTGAVCANPQVVPMFNGGAFIIHEVTSLGDIYGKCVNGIGGITVGGAAGASNGTLIANEATNASIVDVQSFTNNGETASWVNVLYRYTGACRIVRLNTALADPDLTTWTSAVFPLTWDVSGTVKMVIDPMSGDPIIAYVNTNGSGDIIIQRLNSIGNGATIYTYTISLEAVTNKILSLTLSPDGNGGAVVTWADDRYYSTVGYCVFSQYINSAGVPQWDADASAANDYSGIFVAYTSSTNENYVRVWSLFYNDAVSLTSPYGVLYYWWDRRLGIANRELYYSTRSLP